MNKLSLFLKNPIVLVVPIVCGLLLLWQQYTSAQPQISAPQSNILPNASLDEVDGHGFPIGWQLSQSSPAVTAESSKGYSSPTSLVLTNTSDTVNGNTTLTSPIATVKSGETYLYKAFYRSDTPFDLLLRKNYTDGSHDQMIVGRFDPNTEWETASYVFTSQNNVQSVQFIYSFSAKGKLQIDNTYLEPNPSDVYVAPQPNLTTNLTPNSELTSGDGETVDGWSKYSHGDNQATLQYMVNSDKPFLRSQVTAYKSGEAKWQYDPIEAKGGQAYQFNVTYQSDTPASVVAEYTLQSDKRQFEIVKDLLPAKDWTKYSGNLEVPAGAKNVMVTVVQQGNGTVDTRDYGLYNITKPGELTWNKPRLSFTFDDGWESAYTAGSALLNLYGYEGTFYLNPSTIDTKNFMTSAQVTELVQNGHEIASHGYEHLDFTTLDRAGMKYQFEHAYDYFKEVHNLKQVNFSVPFGGNDAQTMFYARKYYTSLRGTGAGVNTRQNLDPYNLKVLYVGSSVSNDKLNAAIADAKSKNGWLILVYHRIDTAAKGETVINPAQFQQQLDSVKASDITVEPVAAALQEIGSQ
jgi:peptidoglycan/xylan/chitin deacetylase (PgdA/CDA1 family)